MNQKTNKAFSLIELSIVLLIIGLLIAGVVKGSQLYQKTITATIQKADDELTFHVNSIGNIAARFDAFNDASFNESSRKDGALINLWRDRKPDIEGSKINVTGTALYKKKGINNLPSISFQGVDGSSHRLISNILPMSDFMQLKAVTIFFVVQQTDSAYNSNGQLISWLHGPLVYVTSFRPNISNNISGASTPAHKVDSKIDVDDDGNPLNYYPANPYLMTVVRNNSEGYIRYKGQTIAKRNDLTSVITASANGKLYLAEWFKGYFGEVIIFKKALKKDEIKRIETYLGRKWGIEVIH